MSRCKYVCKTTDTWREELKSIFYWVHISVSVEFGNGRLCWVIWSPYAMMSSFNIQGEAHNFSIWQEASSVRSWSSGYFLWTGRNRAIFNPVSRIARYCTCDKYIIFASNMCAITSERGLQGNSTLRTLIRFLPSELSLEHFSSAYQVVHPTAPLTWCCRT